MSVPIYLDRVRTYYQDYLPNQTAQLDDPETFFRELAEQISVRVAEVSEQIGGKRTEPGEEYLQRLGKLNTARAQAEELTLDDLLYSIPPESEPQDVASSRDEGLSVMRQDNQAVEQRLQMEEDSPEAASWDRMYPHLIEEVRWHQGDHEGLSVEQKRAQLQAIFAVQDEARAKTTQ